MVVVDNYFPCIIEEMDRLWFHQLILFSEESPPVSPEQEPPVQKPLLMSESLSCPSSMIYLSPQALPDDEEDEETSTDESPSPEKHVSSELISVPIMQDDSISINNNQETLRFHGISVLGNRIRSHSSSPSTQHSHIRKFRKHATTRRKLEKSMSCKTLGELELDEVKGFMDLGFTFKKETLSPRMMRVVPGLHRLGSLQIKHNNTQHPIDATEIVGDNDTEEAEHEKRDGIMRPYLSEAWLIKRPDSPLLNLRIPKSCSAANMKKHLRFWAKTVASEIHQE